MYFYPKPWLSEHSFVQRSAYVIFLKWQQKGRDFQFKMLNIHYSLDNMYNVLWTKCVYVLIKIQMSKVRQTIISIILSLFFFCFNQTNFNLDMFILEISANLGEILNAETRLWCEEVGCDNGHANTMYIFMYKQTSH